jgi:hypothetical protein
LPPYVTFRADEPGDHPEGQLATWVSLYLGPRSSYRSATLDGRPVSLSSQVEGGLSVLSTYVTLDPGQAVTLVLQIQQPSSPRAALLWRQQPRLRPDEVTIRRSGTSQPYLSLYDVG